MEIFFKTENTNIRILSMATLRKDCWAAASGIPVIYRDIKEYSLLYEASYLKAKDTADFIELTKMLFYDKQFYLKGKEI